MSKLPCENRHQITIRVHCVRNVLALMVLVLASARVHGAPSAGQASTPDKSRPLDVGRSVAQAISPGETHAYTVAAKAGEFVHVFVYQQGVHVALTLVGPDGAKLGESNTPQSTQEAEWIAFVAAGTGEYRLDVRAVDTTAPPGRYEIALQERHPSSQPDQVRVTAQNASSEGARLLGDRNYAGAAAKYQEALALYRQSRRRVEEAVTLTCIARVNTGQTDYKSALQRFDEALVIYRELGDLQGVGAVEQDSGTASFNIGRFDDARGRYERALDTRRRVGYRAGEGTSLRSIGSAYSIAGQPDKAVEYYAQALAISRETKFRPEEARALSSLGITSAQLGRSEKAIEYFEAALSIIRELKDRGTEGQILGNIGLAYRNLSKFEDSIKYYEQMLAIAREVGDRPSEARALNNIGHATNSLSRYPAALRYFEDSLVIFKETQNRNGQGMALSNLGNTYFWLAAYDKAIDYAQQALAISREVKNRPDEGRLLNNLGDAYSATGHNETAVDYYLQALAIAKEVKSPAAEARAYGSLSIAYNGLHRYDDAIKVNEQALALFRQVKDQADEAATLVSLGDVYAAVKRHDKAIEYYQEALPIVRTVKDRTGEGLVLASLMGAWKEQGGGPLAIVYGKQSVNAFQDVRGSLKTLDTAFQESYLKSHEDTYRTLADLLIAAGRLAEAEKVLELLKDEEFNRAIRRGAGAADDPISLTASESEVAKVNDQLAALAIERGPLLVKIANNSATDRDRQRLEVIETAITEANKRVKLVLADVAKAAAGDQLVTKQSQSMMQSLRRLGNGTVALYTVVANGNGWVILTTPDFRRAYPIRMTDLNKNISDFRRVLSSDQFDPLPLAKALYTAVFLQKNDQGATLAGDLRGYRAKTLMWSLDGVLRYVPMGALHDGKEYLAERYPSVVFTTASLTRLLDPTATTWRAFGLGVSKRHGDFPALPAVPRELHAIIRESASSEARGVMPGVIRLDEQFTRKAMVDGLHEGYPVVHIASHFSFNAAKEETSFLLLGDGSHLSVEEMQNSPGIFEQVELLTLSACDTATTGANGKEVEGLAFVAQDLGAKAVLATLWPVADVGTEVLMREFYRLREANPRWSKAEALRQAQVALLKMPRRDLNAQLAHPHYWAAFILIGNWR